MPRANTQYDPGAEALRTTATPSVQTEQAAFDPRRSGASRLAEALGKAEPALANFNADYERKKVQEQTEKLESYREQFMQDHAGGAVTQAQVKARFPETVPIIAARIAESVGAQEGRKAIQGVIEEVQGNDVLRLDSAGRAAFLKQKRAELVGQIAPGNEFYANGQVKAIDTELAQFENKWQAETGAYHQKVQAEAYTQEVATAINSGADPTEVDARYEKSSSLNRLERKKLTVNTYLNKAFSEDDPSILDKIPQRFLNEDLKKDVAAVRIKVQEQRMSNYRFARQLEADKREDTVRQGKAEIVADVATRTTVDPSKYWANPELFAYAQQMKEASMIPEAVSAGNRESIRTSILTTATTAGMTQKSAQDMILARRDISPGDQKKLLDEVPKLIEGNIAMNDEMVKSSFSTIVGSRLAALESSPVQLIAYTASGQNFRGKAVQMFDMQIRNSFSAHYQETGSWPTGFQKQKLVDAAVDRVNTHIDGLMNISNLGKPPALPEGVAPAAAPATAKPAAKPTSAPAPAAAAIPKVASADDYNKLPSGAEYLDPNGIKKRKK